MGSGVIPQEELVSGSPGPLWRRGRPLGLTAAPWAPQDRACELVEDLESSRMVRKMKKRICLVLDCLCAHDFSDKTADLINLQHYVIKEKRLSERETVVIFYDVVRIVEALHKVRLLRYSQRPGNRTLWVQRRNCTTGIKVLLTN